MFKTLISMVFTAVLLTLGFYLSLFVNIISNEGAYGQLESNGITITSSTDANDGTFFGEAVIQIVVYDPDDDDNSNRGTKNMDLEVDADNGGSDSITIVVPETSNSSGKFEFFISHVSATSVQPDDLDPLNVDGTDGDGACAANCAPFVTFGPGANLDIDSQLYEEARFEIRTDDVLDVINYEEMIGTLSLDRELYGKTSFVYVFVSDQDANLNPFERDEFTVNPEASPNEDLFNLGGGEFIGAITFKETGDNNAIFEGKYQLGSSISADSESLVLTLHEKTNYNSALDSPENDSNNTDEVFFVVSSSSGIINGGPSNNQSSPITFDGILDTDKDSYFLGDAMTITLFDPDASISSNQIDSVSLEISSKSGGQLSMLALETNESSGTFVVKITLGSAGHMKTGLLPVVSGDVVTIAYIDAHPADYAEKIAMGQLSTKEFVMQINVFESNDNTGQLDGVRSVNMSRPIMKDAAGKDALSATVGEQIILSTTMTNNHGVEHPFVVVIEVRNSEGTTVFLGWQSGILDPLGQSAIGISWSPGSAGDHTVRTFAISSFTRVEILSQISVSPIIVKSE